MSATPRQVVQSAAGRLRAAKPAILENYVVRTREQLDAARTLERAELIDSLPEVLDQLARSLDARGSDGQGKQLDTLGLEHGGVRAGQSAYSLPDVVTEYRILKGLVRAALREGTPLSREAEDAVSDGLDQAMGGSAAEFERRRSEHEVVAATRAEERHKLETIFAASPAAMALWRGPDMVFELVNPAFQAIFPGRPLVGRPFLEALPEFEGQPFFEVFSRVLSSGAPFIGREVLARHRRTEDGPVEDHYYDFTYVRLDDVQGRPYGVYDLAVDVTARVVARRALEEREQQLRDAVGELTREREVRERLIALISHDLRTPLSAARMSAYLVARRARDEDAVRTGASRIAENIDRADGMIRDLLDASRIKAGQGLTLEFASCDLSKLVSDAVVELSAIHGDRFVVRGDERIDGVWSCSALRRILENLCNNAVKYGSAEQPITVTLERRGQEVELRVHNFGQAIPGDELGRLFEPFRRSDSARTGGHRGWGLGLALVKGFAEAHGGQVDVASSAGQGTTFRITLPVDAERATKS